MKLKEKIKLFVLIIVSLLAGFFFYQTHDSTTYIGSDVSLRPPKLRLTIVRVPTIAVNIEVIMPSINVIAKPLIGPVPTPNRTTAAIKVVMFASAIDDSAFS